MRILKPIDSTEGYPIFKEIDLVLLQGLGVMVMEDWAEAARRRCGYKGPPSWFIRCTPTVDVYGTGTIVQFMSLVLACSNGPDGSSTYTRPAAYHYHRDDLMDRLPSLSESEEERAIEIFLDTPAVHLHVNNSCSICTGAGGGQYYLVASPTKEEVLQHILDLKAWATSAYLNDAFYDPGYCFGTMFKEDFIDKNVESCGTIGSALVNTEDLEGSLALAMSLRGYPLTDVLKDYFNETLSYDRCEDVPMFKAKNIRHGITKEKMENLLFLYFAVRVLGRKSDLNVLSATQTGFSKEMIAVIEGITKAVTPDQLFATVQSLIYRHGYHHMDDCDDISCYEGRRRYIFGPDAALSEIKKIFYPSGENYLPLVDFSTPESILTQLHPDDSPLHLLAQRLLRVYKRYLDLNLAILDEIRVHNQEVYDDLVRNLEKDG